MGLGFIFTAKDLASGTMQKLDRNFRELENVSETAATQVAKNFRLMGQGIGMMALGGGALYGLKSLADAAGDFEAAVKSAGLIAGVETPEQLKAFEDAAIEAGIATQFSPTEAVQGLEALASSGLNAKQALEALNPALMLAGASLGQLSVEEAGGLAVQGLNIFSLEASEAGNVVNKFAQLANQSSVSFNNMTLGLGNIARGANAMKQNMDETLITLGLVKGVIPRIDSAATAASVAMERLVDPKHRKQVEAMGVKVTDASGSFRDFLDVIVELQGKMGKMKEGDRSAKLLQIFGSDGLAGAQAVMGALDKGVEDSTGKLLKGAKAVDELRLKMKNAAEEKVAERFNAEMLATFQGQKKLLAGSLETLAIIAGKPLAKIFAPIVSSINEGIGVLIKLFKNMSPAMQNIAAKIAVISAAGVALIGTLAALKGAFFIARIAGFTSMSGLLAGLLPLLPIILAVGAAVVALKIVWEKNFGGIQEKVARTWEVLKLFGEGIYQLFSQGGFSGEVQKALSEPKNASLKEFLIDIYQSGYRVYKFFVGMWKGFTSAIGRAEPTFKRLWVSITKLWAVVERIIGPLFGFGDAIPSDETREWGDYLGDTLGRILIGLVDIIEIVIDVVAQLSNDLVDGVNAALPYFEKLWNWLNDIWLNLFGVTDIWNDFLFLWENTDVWSPVAPDDPWWLVAIKDALGAAQELIKILRKLNPAGVQEYADTIVDGVDKVHNSFEQLHANLVAKKQAQDAAAQAAIGKAFNYFGYTQGSPVAAAPAIDAAIPTGLQDSIAPSIHVSVPTGLQDSVAPAIPVSVPVGLSAGGTGAGASEIMGGLPQARGASKGASAADIKAAVADAWKVLQGQSQTNQTIILKVDGQTIAAVTNQKNQENDQRSFKNMTAPE